MKFLKIVAISDVHCKWNKLIIPPCDILISAGDYSFRGEPHVVRNFHEWLNEQEAGHVISVQGNHEMWVEQNFNEAKKIAQDACPAVYFIDEGPIEIEGIKIWGSAVQPFFMDWAWNRQRGAEIKRHWDRIPLDTDILITHGPPHGILDEVPDRNFNGAGENVGCDDLLTRIKEVKPDLHIFGHIHAGHGVHHEDGTSFYNAAICDESYAATNPVTVIDYERM